MAEVEAEIPQTNEDNMELETNGDAKRSREEEDNGVAEEGGDLASKKQKVEKSVEEERAEKLQEMEVKESGEEEEGGEKKSEPVSLGPKRFESGVEMFDYFYKFLHYWAPNLDVNKYEFMVLLELLKKGHAEPEKKVGGGVRAFQVRYHPIFKSRCFFLVRHDDTSDDFSFRKCVDHILPLPENMKVKSEANKVLGGRGGSNGGGRGGGGRRGGGRGRGGHGRGRGGSHRN